MGRNRRRAERYVKRLEAEFTGAGKTHKGLIGNVSDVGLFIRTNRSFREGSPLDIKVYLPNGNIAQVKGVVRRAIVSETGISAKNGMGVELTQTDANYIAFVREMEGGAAGKSGKEEEPTREKPEALILECPSCGAKNKVPADKVHLGPRCGSCKSPLRPAEETESPAPEMQKAEFLIIACPSCGVKNKVPSDKLSLGPKCGGCKEPLPTE